MAQTIHKKSYLKVENNTGIRLPRNWKGIPVLSEKISGVEGVSVGIWINRGSKHETKELNGITHFIEHMLFKGTKTKSAYDIAKVIDVAGGEGNAFTTRENTCFHINLLGKDLKTAVELLSDIVKNSVFDEEEIKKEKEVISQEIAMVEDSLEEFVTDLFFESVYDGHPLGRPILGTNKSIKKFTREDLLEFFLKYYSPENIVITCAGNVDHLKFMKYLQKYFGKFDKFIARASASARASTDSDSDRASVAAAKSLAKKEKPSSSEGNRIIPPKFNKVVLAKKKDSSQIHAIIGFPAFSQLDKRRSALLILNNHLGGGMSSKFFQKLREDNGLCYSIYSTIVSGVDSGLFTIYFALDKKNLNQSMKLIGKELKICRKELISESELKTLKESLINTILIQSDDIDSKMSYLARSEILYGKYISINQIIKEIKQVTAKDIRDISNQIFDARKASCVAIGEINTKVLRFSFKCL